MKQLSIVSGTFNRLPQLRKMIETARAGAQHLNYEFVIIDAGSTDGTLDYLRSQPDVRLIEHGEKRGAIKAFTEGARAARGQYVLLANDDVTFRPLSILAAVAHLDCNPDCGAVAFADDRPSPYKRGHAVMGIAARRADGQQITVPYAQVGLFRKWLGDTLSWWDANGIMSSARTYGGDSALSALIWQCGYTVDAVPQAMVDDDVTDDAMRAENTANGEADAAHYYGAFRNGVEIARTAKPPQKDKRRLRILYLPIYEPGHAVQKAQKRGLRDALQKVGAVVEIDYLAESNLHDTMLRTLSAWQPDVLFTQLHGADQITPEQMRRYRQVCPRMMAINWNGDVWEHGLTNTPMLDLLHHVDLQLVVNENVIDTYKRHRIPAAYWQIAPEPVNEDALPKCGKHDVVFLGNAYSEERKALEKVLGEFNAGLYGSGWENAAGECLYDFAKGRAIYRNAKIIIGDNQFGDKRGFVSNRLFEALAAGGGLLLHQRIEGLKDLTQIAAGVHYVEWTDLDDLRFKLRYWLDKERDEDSKRIAARARRMIESYHTFDVRVRQLFDELLPLARRGRTDRVKLRYIGQMQQPFGVEGVLTKRQYDYVPGKPLVVDERDAPFVLQQGVWEVV